MDYIDLLGQPKNQGSPTTPLPSGAAPNLTDFLGVGLTKRQPTPASATVKPLPNLEQAYGPLVADTERKFGLPSGLLHNVIRASSGFTNPGPGSGDSIGIAQFTPDTAHRFGIDPTDPHQSILAAGHYLRYLLDKFNQDIPNAVAGYYAGEDQVAKYGGMPPSAATKSYVNSVVSPLPSIIDRHPAQTAGQAIQVRNVTPKAQTTADPFDPFHPFGNLNAIPPSSALGKILAAQEASRKGDFLFDAFRNQTNPNAVQDAIARSQAINSPQYRALMSSFKPGPDAEPAQSESFSDSLSRLPKLRPTPGYPTDAWSMDDGTFDFHGATIRLQPGHGQGHGYTYSVETSNGGQGTKSFASPASNAQMQAFVDSLSAEKKRQIDQNSEAQKQYVVPITGPHEQDFIDDDFTDHHRLAEPYQAWSFHQRPVHDALKPVEDFLQPAVKAIGSASYKTGGWIQGETEGILDAIPDAYEWGLKKAIAGHTLNQILELEKFGTYGMQAVPQLAPFAPLASEFRQRLDSGQHLLQKTKLGDIPMTQQGVDAEFKQMEQEHPQAYSAIRSGIMTPFYFIPGVGEGLMATSALHAVGTGLKDPEQGLTEAAMLAGPGLLLHAGGAGLGMLKGALGAGAKDGEAVAGALDSALSKEAIANHLDANLHVSHTIDPDLAMAARGGVGAQSTPRYLLKRAQVGIDQLAGREGFYHDTFQPGIMEGRRVGEGLLDPSNAPSLSKLLQHPNAGEMANHWNELLEEHGLSSIGDTSGPTGARAPLITNSEAPLLRENAAGVAPGFGKAEGFEDPEGYATDQKAVSGKLGQALRDNAQAKVFSRLSDLGLSSPTNAEIGANGLTLRVGASDVPATVVADGQGGNVLIPTALHSELDPIFDLSGRRPNALQVGVADVSGLANKLALKPYIEPFTSARDMIKAALSQMPIKSPRLLDYLKALSPQGFTKQMVQDAMSLDMNSPEAMQQMSEISRMGVTSTKEAAEAAEQAESGLGKASPQNLIYGDGGLHDRLLLTMYRRLKALDPNISDADMANGLGSFGTLNRGLMTPIERTLSDMGLAPSS